MTALHGEVATARPAAGIPVVAALCLASLVTFLLGIALGPFLPAIAADLGTTVPLLGQVPALAMLGAAVLGLLTGPLADQYGYRRLLVVGALAVIVSALGTAAAFTLAALLVAALCGALSRAIVQPVALAVASSRFEGAARQRAVSWVVASIAGAGIVGVPLLTAVAGLADWRLAFVALGALALLAMVLVTSVLPPDGAPAARRLRPRAVLGAYAAMLRHPPTLALVGSSLLRNAGAWVFYTYLGAYLIQQQHLSVQVAGLGYTGIGVGFFLGSLLAGGRLGQHLQRPALLAVTGLQGLLTAGPILVPLHPLVVIGLLSAGALLNAMVSVGLTVLLAGESPGGRATTMTLNQAALSVGVAVGGAVGGVLLAAGGYHAVAVGVGVFAAGAVLLLLWPSRPPHVAR